MAQVPRTSSHRQPSPERGDRDDFIVCRWCRRPFKAITPTHIYWRHHRPFEAYAETFPTAPLFAPDTLQDITASIIANFERLGRHWTKGRVVKQVVGLSSLKRPLNSLSVKAAHPRLFGAGVRLFGSWPVALRAAGMDPERHERRRTWTTESLVRTLREARKTGLLRKGGRFRKHYPGVVQAVAARWGSWRAGLIALGFKPLRPPPVRWTRAEVRRRIVERVRRGESLLAGEMHSRAPGLRRAAERLLGKHWSEVVRDLGFQYSGRRRWDRKKVVLGIKKLGGSESDLTWMRVRRADYALAQAAVRHFGSWPAAIKASGLDPYQLKPRHWTREELRRLFRAMRQRGKLSRRHLRLIRRSGRVQPLSSVPRYWSSLGEALGTLS